MRVLAIDQGTTSTRGLLFDRAARPHLVAALRHRQIYPQAGWVEHDPLELLRNVRACIAAAGPVDAVALANQGESCLAWDADTLEPLSPVIVWQDRRTAAAVEKLWTDGMEPAIRAAGGVPLDPYFSASKLAWIVRTLPAAAAALRRGRLRLGTTDSFLIEHLTGVWATDSTTASRTGLMDLATHCWSPLLCGAFGVPIETLPPIRATTGMFADPVGGQPHVPLVASIVDQQAALFGHGARRTGDAKITFGTGAFVLAHAGSLPPPAEADGLAATVAWVHGDDTSYALEGGVYDAGSAIEWATRIGLIDDPPRLAGFARPPAIDRGLGFVPALSGLAAPRWRRDARALWVGMTTATTREDMQQALLEGVALQTCEVIATLDRRIGLSDTISVDGGLTASNYFVQFLADASGRTIVRSGNAELTAYGCALLAGHCGHDGDMAAACATFSPGVSPERRASWSEAYRHSVERSLP